ncbi:hypothetical protein A3A38_00235 [Candidatus Kaiserbacteria bacterium RIFCSPLOWO2_01_FULL_53_17]|uniref:Macrocin O-methyltransferase n=1 Tax=Candidatus Kaiserbacteria bacterium RIFCSPLOWO2_01_FULL_53_17 TaxID=1798511 RepID=A0A1F6EG86_9BACT|nr:MAG: hypothetical protein A3A38_00235 [Candidatus Kaiserbacteria bacterium RIFCSPLOWO2_01_FULL_53_17]
MEMLYNPKDLTPKYYKTVQDDEELEHQIGRLQNFRAIIQEVHDKNLKGDFIEFGVFRGFSILWTAYFCQQAGLYDRALMGVDGFIGLSEDDGIFKKGTLSSTSRKECERALKASPDLDARIKERIQIHESLFENIQKMGSILSGKKFVFVHIDCDLGSSTLQLFQRIQETDCLADECFILFDDYGCISSLAKIVDSHMRTLEDGWKITVHSSTKLTKNFHLQKRLL